MSNSSSWLRAFSRCTVMAAAWLLAACGGGGASNPPPTSNNPPPVNACQDCGTAYIAITDADGDFMSYTVDVVSLKLKRANGTLVETLPATTRVDFAQYVDLTEFFTAATIPNGDYVAATLRVDYTNADVVVERGGAPAAARVVGTDGNALGVVDVTVTLDNRHHLVVAPGRPSLFTLDFNLAATHTVDVATTPATVTATPALVASLELIDEKPLRVRGPLVSVDTAASSYLVEVRPFHHRADRFGQVTVLTDSATTFEINGTLYTGAAGLAALNTAGAGTPTVARGTLATATRSFTATAVFAGTSVPGAGIDTVIGDVVARTGDVLNVRGATIVRSSDGARFARGSVQVTLGANTKVVKGGSSPATLATIGDISVGQSIEAFGSANPASTGAMAGDWSLDATAGRVRMNPTPIYGFAKTTGSGSLVLQLESIAGRRVSAFNFAGTGASPAQDADPANYEIATGLLTTTSLAVGEPTKLVGFPTPFGVAPPDFTARTVVDFPRLPATLTVSYGPTGTAAPFSSQNPTGLVLDLDNDAIGRVHVLTIGPRIVDLLALPASPSIVPPTSGSSAYLIVTREESHAYQDFADFVAALGTQLNGSTMLVSFSASGNYNGDTNVLTARSIVVALK
jgi:hypothetical protein